MHGLGRQVGGRTEVFGRRKSVICDRFVCNQYTSGKAFDNENSSTLFPSPESVRPAFRKGLHAANGFRFADRCRRCP